MNTHKIGARIAYRRHGLWLPSTVTFIMVYAILAFREPSNCHLACCIFNNKSIATHLLVNGISPFCLFIGESYIFIMAAHFP